MKRIFVYFAVVFQILIVQKLFAIEERGGLGIKNTCEEQYNINDRENFPQYKISYDRCIEVYNTYSGILDNTVNNWGIAAKSNKYEDWQKVDTGFEELRQIISEKGELLLKWYQISPLLQEIYLYRKDIGVFMESARVESLVQKTGKTVWTIKDPKDAFPTISDTGSLIEPSDKAQVVSGIKTNSCKKGSILNKKTGKCKKVVKKVVK